MGLFDFKIFVYFSINLTGYKRLRKGLYYSDSMKYFKPSEQHIKTKWMRQMVKNKHDSYEEWFFTPDKKPRCDFSDPAIGNYKDLPGGPQRGKPPSPC